MYLLDLYAVLPPNSAIILAVYEAAMNRYDYWVNEEIRMNLKHKILLVVMASLLGFAGLATAGKQGISFYGGLGATAIAPQCRIKLTRHITVGCNGRRPQTPIKTDALLTSRSQSRKTQQACHDY